jgi:hypothetical protein
MDGRPHPAGKELQMLINQGMTDLTSAIGPEIEENHAVTILDSS